MLTASPDQIRRLAGILAAGRVAIGAGVLLAQRKIVGIMGLDAGLTPSGRVILGFFGVRQVALGISVLEQTRAGYPTTSMLRLNAFCDAADCAVLVGSVKHRDRLGRLLTVSLPIAAMAPLVWLWLARQLDEA